MSPKPFITESGEDLTLYPYLSLQQKQEVIKKRIAYRDILIKNQWKEILNHFGWYKFVDFFKAKIKRL